MVVRSLKILLISMLVLSLPQPAAACFGPKLFLGVPDDVPGRVLTSVVAIYVKEKTGIETERVELAGKDVITEILDEKIDYGFSAVASAKVNVLVSVDGMPSLVSGPRIGEDLQFTTVLPALRRLEKLLRPQHVDEMARRVEQGALPMTAAREFLMQQRWI